ncbi:hypothetical protein PanWU01x14_103600 [Parasponia andersonii]|uniref:Uncharacterized protein n=1 Tax=Parasponia andersonii TaxID=3476 RepID=A0A2P5D238_PARAD|nr:hypothetical protein PanWU01x14_103600 [Parasponia andersonii]
MGRGSLDIVIELPSSSSKLFVQALLRDIKRKKVKKLSTDCGEETTESNPIFREIDHYHGEDESISTCRKTSKEASSSFAEPLFSPSHRPFSRLLVLSTDPSFHFAVSAQLSSAQLAQFAPIVSFEMIEFRFV